MFLINTAMSFLLGSPQNTIPSENDLSNLRPPKLEIFWDENSKPHVYAVIAGNELELKTLSDAVKNNVLRAFLEIHPDRSGFSRNQFQAALFEASERGQTDDGEALIELRNEIFPEASSGIPPSQEGGRLQESPVSVVEGDHLKDFMLSASDLDFSHGFSEQDLALIMNLCVGTPEGLRSAYEMINNMSMGGEGKCSIRALHCAQMCILHLKGKGTITEAAYNRRISQIAIVLNSYSEYRKNQKSLPEYCREMEREARILRTKFLEIYSR